MAATPIGDVAHGVRNSVSKGSYLDPGGSGGVTLCAHWIVEAYGTFRQFLGGPALAIGLPTGFKVPNRGSGNSGGARIAGAVPQTGSGDYIDGGDGGRLGHPPHPWRICPAAAAIDFGRIVIWALFVATARLPQDVRLGDNRQVAQPTRFPYCSA